MINALMTQGGRCEESRLNWKGGANIKWFGTLSIVVLLVGYQLMYSTTTVTFPIYYSIPLCGSLLRPQMNLNSHSLAAQQWEREQEKVYKVKTAADKKKLSALLATKWFDCRLCWGRRRRPSFHRGRRPFNSAPSCFQVDFDRRRSTRSPPPLSSISPWCCTAKL